MTAADLDRWMSVFSSDGPLPRRGVVTWREGTRQRRGSVRQLLELGHVARLTPMRKSSKQPVSGHLPLAPPPARPVWFEGALERSWLMGVARTRHVSGVATQPFTVHWEQNGRQRRYTPDFLVRDSAGTWQVWEVQSHEARPTKAEGIAVAAAMLRWVDVALILAGPLPAAVRGNLDLFWWHRFPPSPRRRRETVLALASEPRRYGTIVEHLGPECVHDVLNLLWCGDLRTDLTVPLGYSSWVVATS